MRPGAKAAYVRRAQDIAREAESLSKDLGASIEGPPFHIGVGWGSAGTVITFDDRAVDIGEVEKLAAECIWALFESCRNGSDPSDPPTFTRVIEQIEKKARVLCHQKEQCTETPTVQKEATDK